MSVEKNVGGEVGDSAEQPLVPEGFSEREEICIEDLHTDQIVRFETEDIELDFHVRRPGNLYVLGELRPADTEAGDDGEDSVYARVYSRRYFNKGRPLLIHLLGSDTKAGEIVKTSPITRLLHSKGPRGFDTLRREQDRY